MSMLVVPIAETLTGLIRRKEHMYYEEAVFCFSMSRCGFFMTIQKSLPLPTYSFQHTHTYQAM